MQLVQRGAEVAAGGTDLQTVDVESLELERPRTVGVEHVGLWAMERLGLVWCLTNTVMKMRGHFGCRQGAMTCRGDRRSPLSGVHHARKSNAAALRLRFATLRMRGAKRTRRFISVFVRHHTGEIAGGSGVQRPAGGGGGGVDHRADGAAGVGEGELALAVRAQRAGGVAGGGLRGHEPDASVPCLGCADGASGGHREAPVRAGDGVVRSGSHGDAVRPHQHVFRRRGGGPAQGTARALEREAQ